MNRFLTQPELTTLPGVALKDKPFMLTAALVYRTDAIEGLNQIFMPEFFRTDLATIPKKLRWIYSVAGWWRDASLPHDFCCEPVDPSLNPIPHFCSSDEAVKVWEEALINSINQMDLTPRQYKKKRRTARILTWAVKTGGPRFAKGDTWA